ncbi:zinc-dependent alcohol dehydrogenase family protein [Skermanella pratensis]|uniref:zinc-dependent alcohol dehydrogenase family protein n=1 Tax=Skermanella pratensis TaxID=2233999 RepID=UPI0013015BBF|nr:zinc-dependent alcohol dehydrogenase family protein [Skermanella pratensis]
MRSIRYERFGEPSDVLFLEEREKPRPGPGEALVRLRLRSINPADLLQVRGLYGQLPQLPATAGMEGVGVIEELGEGVAERPGLTVGSRVMPLGSPAWQEYACVKAAALLPIPDAMPDQVAAQAFVNPVTAWLMTVEELKLKPGDTVLVTAAGSALGRIVIQLSRRLGFKVIGTVRRSAQADELMPLGAHAIVSTADDDLRGRVLELTGGRGADGAIEAVGGAVGAAAASALAPGGTMLVYGLMSGEPIPVPVSDMIFKTLSIRGFWLADWARKAPDDVRSDAISEVFGLLAEGGIDLPVAAVYDLAEIRDAVMAAESSGRPGKVLLGG